MNRGDEAIPFCHSEGVERPKNPANSLPVFRGHDT
jgi:hypothetical protein